MAEISAALVKELRDLTGAGMMDCKRALQETDGDVEAARKLLRERGMAQAGKRAGRETTEGRVLVRAAAGVGAIVAVGCETEPVSKNEAFRAFAEKALDTVFHDGEGAADALEAERVELVSKLGENIVIRTGRQVQAIGGEDLAQYVHAPAHKIGVLVRYRGDDADAARRVAMHIASEAPQWLSREQAPADAVSRRARDLPQLRRGAEQARAGPREDRGGDAVEALLRGEGRRAPRPGVHPRHGQERRPGADRGGDRGRRLRPRQRDRVRGL